MQTVSKSIFLIALILPLSASAEEPTVDPLDQFLSTEVEEPTADLPAGFAPVDLRPYENHNYNTWKMLVEIANQRHTLEGVPFTLRTHGLRVRGDYSPDDPTKIEGIKIDRPIHKLHVLHATEHGGRGHRIQGIKDYVKDGTLIGQYQVHYADGLIELIPIVYGEDVRDWWNWDSSKPCKRSKVAWKGDTPHTRQYNIKVRLYLTSWTNPRPEKKVASITMVSTADSAASPFCVAMTMEDPPSDAP